MAGIYDYQEPGLNYNAMPAHARYDANGTLYDTTNQDVSQASANRLNGLGAAGQTRKGLQNDVGLSQIAHLYGQGQDQAAYLHNAMVNGGPSVASLQQSHGLDASLHNAAGSMGGSALASRGAFGGDANAAMGTVAGAAHARNAEQQNTMHDYQSQLGQNAGLSEAQLHNSQFNASQEMNQRDLNDKYQLGMQGIGLNTQQSQLNNDLNMAGYNNQVSMQQDALGFALRDRQMGAGLNAAAGGATALGRGLGSPDPQDNAQYRQAWNNWDPSMGGSADAYAESQMSDVHSKRRIRALESELAARDTYDVSDSTLRRVTPEGYDMSSYRHLPPSATAGADGFRFHAHNPSTATVLTKLAENGYGRGIAETYPDEIGSDIPPNGPSRPSPETIASMSDVGLPIRDVPPDVPNAGAYGGDAFPARAPVDVAPRSHHQMMLDAGILSQGPMPHRVAPTALDLAADRLSEDADRRAASLRSDVHSKKEIQSLQQENDALKNLARHQAGAPQRAAEQDANAQYIDSQMANWANESPSGRVAIEKAMRHAYPEVRYDMEQLHGAWGTPYSEIIQRGEEDEGGHRMATAPRHGFPRDAGRFVGGKDMNYEPATEDVYARPAPLVRLEPNVPPRGPMPTSQLRADANTSTRRFSPAELRSMKDRTFGDAGYAATQAIPVVSDERQKTHVDRFLDNVEPVSYEYKNPEIDGHGRQYGIIAQDLEKSPMGRSMVIETPRGLMVDTRKAALGGLAALADHQRRIEELEARRG
jgi:endosialidase-like protein